MSKKRAKTPATSKLTAKKTEAPKLLTRDDAPVVEMAPPVVEEAVVVEMMPAVVEVPAPVVPVVIDRKQIAWLAFSKFVARGYVHGHDVDDWLSAEAELRARVS